MFLSYFAPSIHCKYDFIPLTSRPWAPTWKLRTGHIILSDVPSKTEHRILYISKSTTRTEPTPFPLIRHAPHTNPLGPGRKRQNANSACYNLNWCPFYCSNPANLSIWPVCCLHPVTYSNEPACDWLTYI